MRSCGVLMHITSLPSPYGIGTMGPDAEQFVDWLKDAGQSYWQILPIGPTGYGDSPYQSFSSFAGNPLMIDMDDLVRSGYLSKEQCEQSDFGADPTFVDFDKVYRTRMQLFREAFASFSEDIGYLSFIQQEAYWLDDYALFMALKEKFKQAPWQSWDPEFKLRKPEALARFKEENFEKINFWKFLQYIFYRQWEKLHRYANKNGVQIIGDIPFYTSMDSADVWANLDMFKMDREGIATSVAGVPPDYFSTTGQLWGNPVYNWENLKKEKYSWWIHRIKHALLHFDLLRIDHFRAFDTYYSIPSTNQNAIGGKWEKGPGEDFFNVLQQELGKVPIIAEDLGELFDSTRELLSKTGFPGMRVLQFGFNTDGSISDHLPFLYPKNCVAYTGTHDNPTTKQWLASNKTIKRMARQYLRPQLREGLTYACIRGVYASPAALVIIPMQDILRLDGKARMNTPGTLGENWIWRMKKGANLKTTSQLYKLAKTYFRAN
jgi:4-alpha-glucanotransferase